MSTCTAYGCTNRASHKKAGVTFHKFPSEPRLRKVWIAAVKRKNWEPSQYSSLCSEHFTEDQIDRTSKSCVRLRKNAVPTKFNFPSYIKKILEEKAKIERTYKDQSSSSDNSDSDYMQLDVKSPKESCEDSDPDGDIADLAEYVKSNQNSVVLKSGESSEEESYSTLKPHLHKSLMPEHSSGTSTNSATVFPMISNVSSAATLDSAHYVPVSLLSELSNSLLVKKTFSTRDASTSPSKHGCDEADLMKRLENSDKLITNYRKKIRTLQQQNRRYRTRLLNMKHSIFAELQKRQYLSSDSNFKVGHDGCLLDRHSVRLCQSSESDDVEEDV